MKSAYICEYCSKVGTKEEIKEHEIVCEDNYDRLSCYTCANRGKVGFENKMIKYECKKDIDIPAGKIIEFCKSYVRREKEKSPYMNLFNGFFGGY